MIDFKSFTLDNGLRVVVHEDAQSTVAVVNIMYHVGSRDESPERTGLAHLFEHLMFGGSKHVTAYDQALQRVGGDSNAYTTPDVTNYYCTLPVENLETAFWVESDRMLALSFSEHGLAVQQKVVIEEFKERYLDQPYGDAWLKLCALAYTQHPYRWPTIGKSPSHIECVDLKDIKDFYNRFYLPNNAVLVVAGGVQYNVVKQLSEKWFAPIPAGPTPQRTLPQEPPQTSPRSTHVTSEVPMKAIYKAYHMPGRLSPDYHAVALLSDILGGGRSSQLYAQLVDQQQYLTTVGAYVTETVDPGLLIISGKVNDDVAFDKVERMLDDILMTLQEQHIGTQTLTSVKNQAEAYHVRASMGLHYRAQALAEATTEGDTHLVNKTIGHIHAVTPATILGAARSVLRADNCTTVYYQRGES